MALKAERITILETQRSGGIAFDGTTTPGKVICNYSDTQGIIYDETSGTAPPRPLGILTHDIDNDYTKDSLGTLNRPENVYKNIAGSGEAINLLAIGVVYTNDILTTDVPAAGSGAYVASSGKISTTDVYNTSVDNTATYTRKQIGYFLSDADSNGYAKVAINVTGV